MFGWYLVIFIGTHTCARATLRFRSVCTGFEERARRELAQLRGWQACNDCVIFFGVGAIRLSTLLLAVLNLKTTNSRRSLMLKQCQSKNKNPTKTRILSHALCACRTLGSRSSTSAGRLNSIRLCRLPPRIYSFRNAAGVERVRLSRQQPGAADVSHQLMGLQNSVTSLLLVCVAVACSLHSLHSLLTTTPHTHCLAHSLTACADRGVHRDRIGCTAR